MVDLIFNTSWNSITKWPKGGITTTLCCKCHYKSIVKWPEEAILRIKFLEARLEGTQAHHHDEHMESPYTNLSINPKLLDKVILCCIKQSSLKEIYLSAKHCDCRTLTLAAKAIEVNNTITKLHIEHCHIDKNEAIAITDCLKLNALKELHISNCELGDQALKVASGPVICSTCLNILNISGNTISDDDMKLVGACLKDNKSLQELDMVCTKMSNEGAKHIGVSLKTNNTLTTLNIAENTITNTGAI